MRQIRNPNNTKLERNISNTPSLLKYSKRERKKAKTLVNVDGPQSENLGDYSDL
jgi:hypothetical protein